MRLGRLIALAAVAFLLVAGSASAKPPVRIFYWSAQGGPSHATAGGSIHVSTPVAGRPSAAPQAGTPPSEHGGGKVSPYPTVPSNSPVLTKPTAAGSFWYPNGNGQQCLYTPDTTETALCVNVVTPGAPPAPAAPPVDPTTLATAAAKKLSLGAGQVSASPSASVDGLTGAASWFWLTPTPGTDTVAVTTGGEHVTVTATESSVDWSFGDNTTLDGGPGVPYDADSTPAGAVTHAYETRCLPGDQGHDPYVLASCGPNGYTITATVAWSITYTATGSVNRSGPLTSRTTSASVPYPVTEARGFLTSAGSA